MLVGRIDNSPAVVCKDQELILSTHVSSMQDLADVARAASVPVSGPGPWRFGCEDKAPAPSEKPAGEDIGKTYASSTEAKSEDSRGPSTASLAPFAEGSKSRVDMLISRGFAPVGCVDGKFVFRSRDGWTVSVPVLEARRAQVGPVLRCRV